MMSSKLVHCLMLRRILDDALTFMSHPSKWIGAVDNYYYNLPRHYGAV